MRHRSQAEEMVEALGYRTLDITTHNDRGHRYLVTDQPPDWRVSGEGWLASGGLHLSEPRPATPSVSARVHMVQPTPTFFENLVQYLKECW